MTEEQINDVDGEGNLIASYGELEELEQKFQYSKIMLDWTRKSDQPFEIRAIAIIVFRHDRKILSIELDNRQEDSDVLGFENGIAEWFRRTPFGSFFQLIQDSYKIEEINNAAIQDQKWHIDRGLSELYQQVQGNRGSEKRQVELLRSYLMDRAEKEGFRYVGKNKRLQQAINSISDRTGEERIVGDDGELIEKEIEA